MSARYENTEPIDVLGCFLDLRVRCIEIREPRPPRRLFQRYWQAYYVLTGPYGGVYLKPLRTRRGKPVRSHEGVGDLIEIIEELAKEGKLQ
jgi:hypothetical protein